MIWRRTSLKRGRSEPQAALFVSPKRRSSLLLLCVHDFFSNSGHFPIANFLLEAFLLGSAALVEPGVYIMLFAGALQACFFGVMDYQGRSHSFLGNLVGPIVYTMIDLPLEGEDFFQAMNHWAYWAFSFAIAVFAALQDKFFGRRGDVCLVLENMTRTLIVLGVYWIFEIHTDPAFVKPSVFFADASHDFFALAVIVFGTLIGLEKVNSRHRLEQVVVLNERLREYSKWLLGEKLLARALSDPAKALRLQRRSRHVLFMDIRGFSGWSEDHSPELVVQMLNEYFSLSEDVCEHFHAIKAKYTGDEVMVVFERACDVVEAAMTLRKGVGRLLAPVGLSIGMGIHYGPLMEGALGSEKVKAYDVIGDTVNTAKRLCDSAEPDEVLVSNSVMSELKREGRTVGAIGPSRIIQAKGKREAIEASPLEKL